MSKDDDADRDYVMGIDARRLGRLLKKYGAVWTYTGARTWKDRAHIVRTIQAIESIGFGKNVDELPVS